MFKNLSSNWSKIVVTIVVNFFLTPYLIRQLGVDLYGSWAVIMAYVGWLSLMQVGIPMAAVRAFSQAIARDDIEELNVALATALRITLLIGITAALLGCVLFLVYNTINIPRIPEASLLDARIAFFIAVSQLIIGFTCQIPHGLMASYHDFPASNILSIFIIIARCSVLVFCLILFPGTLILIATTNLFITVVEGALGFGIIKKKYPTIVFSGTLNRVMAKSLLGFSFFVLLLNLGNQLSFATDSIVISAFLNNSAVTSFENGKMFIIYLTDFIIAIGAILMPYTVKFEVLGNYGEIRALLKKWIKGAISISLLPGIYLIICGEAFITRWIDAAGFNAKEAGMVLTVLMISHLAFLPARGVSLPILMGLGRPISITVVFVMSSIFNVLLSVVLVKPYGLLGVALGTAIPEVVFAIYAIWFSCKKTGANFGNVIHYALIKIIPATILVYFTLSLLFNYINPTSWFSIIGIGVVHTVIFSVVWIFFVYRNDPYFNLISILKELFKKVVA